MISLLANFFHKIKSNFSKVNSSLILTCLKIQGTINILIFKNERGHFEPRDEAVFEVISIIKPIFIAKHVRRFPQREFVFFRAAAYGREVILQ